MAIGFLSGYSGEAREQRSPQPSAEHQERTAPRTRLNYDVCLICILCFTKIKRITIIKISKLCIYLQEVADKGGDNLPAVPSHNNQNKRHITRPDSHSGDHSIKGKTKEFTTGSI